MSEERRKVVWLWLAALIAIPVLYVASFGPACWLCLRAQIAGDKLRLIYRPILIIGSPSEYKWPDPDDLGPAQCAILWYANLLAPPGKPILIHDGEAFVKHTPSIANGYTASALLK